MSKKAKLTGKELSATKTEREHKFTPLGLLAIMAIIITYLLPVKFGSITAIPEVAGNYPDNILTIFIFIWPSNIFFLCSGLLLFLTTLTIHQPLRINYAFFFMLIIFALIISGFIGFARASTSIFPVLETIHITGIAVFSFAVFQILQVKPEWGKWFILAIVLGTFTALFGGVQQYLFGMAETKNFVYQQELKSGIKLSSKFHTRLGTGRVFATFSLCNSFAAHLLLTGPLCLYWVWQKAGKVDPPKLTRAIFVSITAFLLLSLLLLTRSRAAIVAFGAAFTGIALFMPLPRKAVIAILATLLLLMAVAFGIINNHRNLASANFRLDYYTVATKIFRENIATGTGWGDFFHEYMKLKQLNNDEAPHTPHNMILAFASQTGIAGLVTSGLMLIYPFFILVVLLRRKYRDQLKKIDPGKYTELLFDYRFVILLGWTAWAVHALADINFQIPGSVATAVVMILVALPHNQQFTAKKLPYRYFAPILLLIGISLSYWSYRLIAGDRKFNKLQEYCDPRYVDKKEFAARNIYTMQSYLENCLKENPWPSPFPYASAANFAAAKGFPDLAESYLRQAIKLAPERSSLYWRLGIIQIRLKKYKEADHNFRKAKSLFPRHPQYSKYPAMEAFR